MKVFGLAGWSGSGKTTLLRALIPALVRRGLRVSTLKHADRSFDIDRPGKDSYEHRQAGATEVLISSARRWALIHESRGAPEPLPRDLIGRMTPVDLLLIEGFKTEDHDKLEIHRPSLGKPLLCPGDPRIVALASDAPVEVPLPRFDLDDIEGIANFVIERYGFGDRVRESALE